MKNHEDQFKVTITESFVQVKHPARKTEMIRRVDIEQIKLVNTGEGPLLPDPWLGRKIEKQRIDKISKWHTVKKVTHSLTQRY